MSAPGVLGLFILAAGVGLVIVMLVVFGWGDPPFGWYTA